MMLLVKKNLKKEKLKDEHTYSSNYYNYNNSYNDRNI
jgi:hypothetical protein